VLTDQNEQMMQNLIANVERRRSRVRQDIRSEPNFFRKSVFQEAYLGSSDNSKAQGCSP
jgi:hypothetical protein